MMAASLVCAVPVVVLYFMFQKYLVGGLTAGSVKWTASKREQLRPVQQLLYAGGVVCLLRAWPLGPWVNQASGGAA